MDLRLIQEIEFARVVCDLARSTRQEVIILAGREPRVLAIHSGPLSLPLRVSRQLAEREKERKERRTQKKKEKKDSVKQMLIENPVK